MEWTTDSLDTSSMKAFHPAVRAWFEQTFRKPTEAQCGAWPAIKSGQHTLIAAPTGSGKTLAAFLATIDNLVWQAVGNDLFDAHLQDQTQIVYVSPLKALSNDIHRNLAIPLQGIRDQFLQQGLGALHLHAMVRSGDTPQSERQRMRRKPPHILVTTPESLYLLLSSDSGRQTLSTVHTLIVDEIHALAGNKRGAHLALSMERLQDLCGSPLTRIGLSATQSPISTVAHFLTGAAAQSCTIIDSGHRRNWDLALELSDFPLEAVMSAESWEALYQRLQDLIECHHTTLVFVNTRRLAERLAKALSERLGDLAVTSHHGSLAREHRLEAEQRLKQGELRALVATASLELGIDIGDVDLVCQIGSPRGINPFLQRVGRSGHALDAVPKGRLFPTSRDELVECAALLDTVNKGELDQLCIPKGPLDVLSQQLVAEVSCAEYQEQALFDQVRRAWPYRSLSREDFDAVVSMLASGFSTRRGRRSAWLHQDRVNQRLRPRRGARLAALLNGGAIPDLFDYDVILQPEGRFIGTLNEDFAFESLAGDIFQLGNASYRILKTERGKVHVEDARGQPPNIPFWFGEAPGRSDALSQAVSRLRIDIQEQLETLGIEKTAEWVETEMQLTASAASQLTDYLSAAHAALGVLPNQQQLVFERFFDEAGDQHLVIHSPFGSRLNRAWGLALRKRFCRKFNFELQAAALEDCIVLSLGSTHSFPLEEVSGYLKSKTVYDLLVQALFDVPLFATHWRWNATIGLAVRRNRNGQRVPAQLQRMDAEDLIAVVFPDQLACLENIAGNREIPDHPLVDQTIHDCLHQVMDIDTLQNLLRDIEEGRIQIIVRDLAGPSPLAQEILSARSYAFLDDAPAEERRTQMVQARRFMTPQQASELAVLNPEAIEKVCIEAWPQAGDADELHDALMLLGFITDREAQRIASPAFWRQHIQALLLDKRVTALWRSSLTNDDATHLPIEQEIPCQDDLNGERLWVCAEHLAMLQTIFPQAVLHPCIEAVGRVGTWTRSSAIIALLRARLQGLGPVTLASLVQGCGLEEGEISAALLALEAEGYAMRGRFSPTVQAEQWCERGLLARIHRYTIKNLRDQIRPVCRADFMSFLLKWHGLVGAAEEPSEGEQALRRTMTQLEGFQAPAAAWENEILPARLKEYRPSWLDRLCSSGRIMWLRPNGMSLRGGAGSGALQHEKISRSDQPLNWRGPRKVGPLRTTPIALITRRYLRTWNTQQKGVPSGLSSPAKRVLERLEGRGASFVDEIIVDSGLLHTQVEEALAELVSYGLVSSDAFAGLRALLLPSQRRKALPGRHRRGRSLQGIEDGGRWFLLQPHQVTQDKREISQDLTDIEHIARVLLHRYGVVFRALLRRETGIPAWRDLLYLYRLLEARGEVRGGRFVEGFSGEQFALPEAVGLLRKVQRAAHTPKLISISAADPLNLLGIVLSGQKVPALTGNRILFRGGQAVAIQVAGDTQILTQNDETPAWEMQAALRRHGGFHRSMKYREVIP